MQNFVLKQGNKWRCLKTFDRKCWDDFSPFSRDQLIDQLRVGFEPAENESSVHEHKSSTRVHWTMNSNRQAPLRRFYSTSKGSLVCPEPEVTTIGCTSYKTSEFVQRRQPESRSTCTPLLKVDWSTIIPLMHTCAQSFAASTCYERWKQGKLWEWSWEFQLDAIWTIVPFL